MTSLDFTVTQHCLTSRLRNIASPYFTTTMPDIARLNEYYTKLNTAKTSKDLAPPRCTVTSHRNAIPYPTITVPHSTILYGYGTKRYPAPLNLTCTRQFRAEQYKCFTLLNLTLQAQCRTPPDTTLRAQCNASQLRYYTLLFKDQWPDAA